MKRIKFMLLSLTLLAVVGGALAFKAKFNETQLCTTITTDAGENPTCPIIDDFQLQLTATSFYTTITNPTGSEPCKADDGSPLQCEESTNKYNFD